MKNNKLFLFITALVMLFSFVMINGCKKDDNNTTPDNTDSTKTPKIKTLTYVLSNGNDVTETYVYDEQGRIITKTFSGSSSNVISYSYNTNSIIMYNDRDKTTHTFELNSNGYATSEKITDAQNNVLSSDNYTYDSDGHLTTDGEFTYTWSGGNLVSKTNSNGSRKYTYFSDKTNTIGNQNRGISFLGVDSKNLISSNIYNDDITNTQNYSYEYDSLNRVTKLNSNTYTYY
jgi:hypothetical protein